MPSTFELILFFSLFVIMGVIGVLEEKRAQKRKQVDHTLVPHVKNSLIHYSSAVCWFRDYWSNRLKLKRNVQKPEGFEIDTGSSGAEELPLEVCDVGRCSVQGLGQRFADLADPHELIHQYSPKSIIVRMLGGRSIFQLPGAFWGEYKEGDSVDARMSRLKPPVEPEEVYTEPMVQTKREIWAPIFWAATAVFIIWLESILFRYFIPLFPWLESIQLLIMALTLVGYLAILAIVIIREATTPIKEAFAGIYLYDGDRPKELHYHFSEDVPKWLESKPYWVLRYMFRWKGELTLKEKLPIPHFPEDWERVEVWLDARTGVVEWIVSDYHWRELWYKAQPNLQSILLWIYPDFHTPLPLNIETERKGVLKDLYAKEHLLSHAWKRHFDEHASLHSESWTALQMGSRYSPAASQLSKLWWDKWRYPYGANSDLYKNSETPPAVGEQPTPTST